MTMAAGNLSQLIREAQMPGDVAEPTALLEALVGIENPIGALFDHDQTNNLFAAFDNEFGFIRLVTIMNYQLLQPQQLRWVSLLRWLLHELSTWNPSQDLADRKLAAIFVVSQANDWKDGLWTSMPTHIGLNTELIQRVKGIVGSFSITFAARGGAVEPIWEREAIEKFKVADAQGDWAEIGTTLRLFEHQILPGALQAQSVRCLHFCGVNHLVNALNGLRQTLVALQVASALLIDQRLSLGVASSNPYVQLACVYQTLSGRYAARRLSSEEQEVLGCF